jgi:GMP synthase (glutamine-hydrolysing)
VRLGLLVCDHVSPELISVSGDYDTMFRLLFSGHPNIEIVAYDAVGGEMPASPGECDAWLTTGSRHSVNERAPWIDELEEFVRETARRGVPFVGICFGHQLLAKALGGDVGVSDHGWGVGIKKVEITPGLRFVPDGVAAFAVFNSHSEQIERLPAGAEVIGRSDHCPVSMMTVGGSMLGLQGHPEMDLAYGAALIESRRDNQVPEEVAVAALASLDSGTDNPLVAEMIVRFVRKA